MSKIVNDFPLVKLWAQKSIIVELAWQLTQNKYQGSYIGFLWIILEPLFALSILYIVFSTIRSGMGPEYAVYLLSGIVIFQVFARGTQHGLTSLRGNEGIINSMRINKEVFPVSAAISSAFVLMIQVGIFFSLAVLLSHEFSLSLLFLPVPLVLLFLLILGLSYILSIIFVYIRDIQPAWSIFSYALFFVSPIFWFVDEIDGILLIIYQFNPLGRIIELFHDAVFGPINIENLIISITYVLAILFVGMFVFKRIENKIAQEL